MLSKKTITRLLLLFYLFGTFASAIHIHHDQSTTHLECKICIVSHNMLGSDAPSATPHIEELTLFNLLALEPNNYLSSLILKGYHSQAPPSFS